MINVLVEFRENRCEKLVKLLSKFKETADNEFKVWIQDKKTRAYIKILHTLIFTTPI